MLVPILCKIIGHKFYYKTISKDGVYRLLNHIDYCHRCGLDRTLINEEAKPLPNSSNISRNCASFTYVDVARGNNDTFTNFEKLYGTTEFLKAIITIQNQLLVDKGITTTDDLRSRLQTELIIRAAKEVA